MDKKEFEKGYKRASSLLNDREKQGTENDIPTSKSGCLIKTVVTIVLLIILGIIIIGFLPSIFDGIKSQIVDMGSQL